MQHLVISTFLLLILNACSHIDPPLLFPQPLRAPLGEIVTENSNHPDIKIISPDALNQPLAKTRIQTAPSLPKQVSVVENKQTNSLPPFNNLKPIGLNVDNIPLPTFINEVFANILKLNIQIDAQLKDKTDLVTLNIATPQSAKALFRIARRVLNRYGVIMLQDEDAWFFTLGQKKGKNKIYYETPPLLVSGRTLPNVPAANRLIFQFIPLNNVRLDSTLQWIERIYNSKDVELIPNRDRNTLIVVGKKHEIQRFMGVLAMLDQPLMRGRHGVVIRPTYITATALSNNLTQALRGEGYAASNSVTSPNPIIILPFKESNTVLAFTGSEVIMKHIRSWVDKLDQTTQSAEQHGFFFYAVQNTPAEHLADIVKQLLSGNITQKTDTTTPKKQSNQKPITSTIVVDNIRNALIFKGSNEEWVQLLPIIKKLDIPPKMVLIDMIVAEITLSDEVEFGIEWLLRNAGLGQISGNLGTLATASSGGLGLTARGLNYFPISNAGQTLAAINAFAGSNRVSILSNPHLMVRSGEEAKIQVGSEVPIVTSSSTAPDLQQNGNSSILQQIQYRSTGVTLTISPIVYAGNRIDLDIHQEVSQAELNETSSIGSPIILNRSIQTKLSLEDGGSVLLGGLISNSTTNNETNVPLISDIPIIGNLFKVKKDRAVRTELLMIILPYVIHDQQAAEVLTQGVKQRFQLLKPLLGMKTSSETPVPNYLQNQTVEVQ